MDTSNENTFVSKRNLKSIWQQICNLFLTKNDASSTYLPTIGGTVTGELFVDNALSVSGVTNIDNKLVAPGFAVGVGSATFSTPVTINDVLSVTGELDLNSDLIISKGNIHLNGAGNILVDKGTIKINNVNAATVNDLNSYVPTTKLNDFAGEIKDDNIPVYQAGCLSLKGVKIMPVTGEPSWSFVDDADQKIITDANYTFASREWVNENYEQKMDVVSIEGSSDNGSVVILSAINWNTIYKITSNNSSDIFSLTISSLPTIVNNTVDRQLIMEFDCGVDDMEFNIPQGVFWANGESPSFKTGRHYIITIKCFKRHANDTGKYYASYVSYY